MLLVSRKFLSHTKKHILISKIQNISDAIANKLSSYLNLEIARLAQDAEPEILCWSIKNNQNIENATCVYIGEDNQSFFNILMALKCQRWLLYDPDERTIKETAPADTKWLKRRYFYVEKCKDAQIIGIVVGTLTSKGYLDMVKHIQELCKKANRKTYIFSVGKVNPAKLANFMDIDCFVLIGCPENTIYNSRDFYKPIVSMFEVEMALNPAWHMQIPETYSTDLRDLLPEGRLYRSSNDVEMTESDVSLVTGKIRGVDNTVDQQPMNGVIQEKNLTIQAHSTAERFQNRTFKGLEPALGKTEPSRIEKGRSGIAIRYEDNSMEF
jgi:diphthamide biosynthesis protein 2